MKLTFLNIVFLISFTSFGQVVTKPYGDEILYESASVLKETYLGSDLIMLIDSNDSKIAEIAKKLMNQMRENELRCYDDLIDYYPKSDLLVVALYEKGGIEYQNGNIKVAKEAFLRVVSLNVEGRGYYTNRSLWYLAEIEIGKKNYKQALEYLETSKQNFKPFYDCGNARESDERILKRLYDLCNEGLKEKK